MRQRLEERPLLGLRRQREQLLELVDDQEQLTVLGNHAPQREVDAADAPELLGEAVGVADRNPRRLSASSLYGAPPGSMVATNQAVRAGGPSGAQPGEQAGSNGAGLAGAGRPDQQHQPTPQTVAGQAREYVVDERRATEVVLRVGLVERAQTLVRVARRGASAGSRAPSAASTCSVSSSTVQPVGRHEQCGQFRRDVASGQRLADQRRERAHVVLGRGRVRSAQPEVGEDRLAGGVVQHVVDRQPAVHEAERPPRRREPLRAARPV